MENQQWIDVKLDAEKTKHHENIRGFDVALYVSPYDVPAAIRGFYDQKKSRFIIEFKYIGDETKTERQVDRYVSFSIGKNSRRLYAVEIDVNSLRAQKISQISLRLGVQNEVDQAIDGLLRAPLNPRRLENYQLAKEALTSKRQELFAAIA